MADDDEVNLSSDEEYQETNKKVRHQQDVIFSKFCTIAPSFIVGASKTTTAS